MIGRHRPLAAALRPRDAESGHRIRTGIIEGTAPLTVNVGGIGGLPASRLASYTPTTGHRVLIIQDEATYCVIGRIIPGE